MQMKMGMSSGMILDRRRGLIVDAFFIVSTPTAPVSRDSCRDVTTYVHTI